MIEYNHKIWIWEFLDHSEKSWDEHYMDQLFLYKKMLKIMID
jgi:hypothetical protein